MSQFEAYMPQQRSAIDYMVCRCHNREGLIVYHGMGSGKSVIGAGLVVNMKMPWVLLAPKSLHNQWQEDYINHFQMTKPSHKIELCADNATSLLNVLANPAYADTFAESLIIVDEAHNLSRCFETLTPEKRELAYTSLWRFKRRILMTGTPVYWSLRDLCVLTNVAHGRHTFPIDAVEFDKQYYKVDRFRSVVEGWIAPIGKFLSTIAIFAYTAGSTAISTQNVETVMENKLLRILVEKMSQYADLLGLLARKTDALGIKKIRDLGMDLTSVFSGAIETVMKTAFKWTPPEQKPKKYSEGNYEYGREFNKEIQGIMSLAFIFWLIPILIKLVYTRNSDIELKQLKYDKFVKQIAPYLSYYEHPSITQSNQSDTFLNRAKKMTRRMWNPKSDHHTKSWSTSTNPPKQLPVVSTKTTRASYNGHQTCIFMRYTMGRLSLSDYIELGIVKNKKEALVYPDYDQNSPRLFRDYGRMIGNVCTYTHTKTSRKLYRPFKYDSKTSTYTLDPHIEFAQVSSKYKQIAKRIQKAFKQNPNTRIVVYSNFNVASATLSAYLNSLHIGHMYKPDSEHTDTPSSQMTIQMKNWGGNLKYHCVDGRMAPPIPGILLLGASYSEGLSIKKVHEMHILEPCVELAKIEQVRARVVRLDSHLPGEKVNIYEWWSDLQHVFSILDKWNHRSLSMPGAVSLTTWFKEIPSVWYSDVMMSHRQCITPDAIVMNELTHLEGITKELNKRFMYHSIDYYSKMPRDMYKNTNYPYPKDWHCRSTKSKCVVQTLVAMKKKRAKTHSQANIVQTTTNS